ncbi:MAG: HAD-IC family P-type ATPase, partial [Deltaproteobacteria bacterium]|nr:HAD-IC family P-type ATPase [Deltaproteobacteria bacterium]
DQLGAYYTPLAVVIAAVAWGISGDPTRFLAVLVVATPCPLLIAIPVALIGTISLAARRSIVIRDPACLELIDSCRTIILDKTGTLTQGKPSLTNIHVAPGQNPDEILALAATLEQYSKHPLAGAVIREADNRKVSLREASDISEPPGFGLRGTVDGRQVAITGRKHVADQQGLPPQTGGLECVILLDEKYAGTLVFHDRPLTESGAFVRHLRSRHKFAKIMIVSGDRESEVRHLADQVGITDIYAEQTPEQKVEITRAETAKAPTLFMGDGINDAPALLAATVGIAFGPQNDVASEAAGAVVLESSLVRVDELFHLSRRMRRIALESAVGGMLLSVCGMFFAAAGLLPPVAGALVQEAIDLAAIMNALRASFAPSNLTDVDSV